MTPYRPALKRQIQPKKPIKPYSPVSISDMAKELSNISDISRELFNLKNRYIESIEELSFTADETKNGVKEKLAQIDKKFIEDAKELLKKTSYELLSKFEIELRDVIGQLKKEARDVQGAIDSAKLITKGDKGETGESGADGEDGESPDMETIIREVLLRIPIPRNGRDAVINEKDIINKIINEILKKDFLKIDNIAGLAPQLRHIQSKTAFSGGSGGGGGSWHQANLTGTINGSNTVFTFSGVKANEFSERIYLNYTEQNPIVPDYTINYETNTVTYTVAPDALLSGFPHIIRYHA